MSTNDDVQYRQHYQADPDDVSVREDADEGMFAVRMPIASTGEVRNEGDDPLNRDAIEGMAQQLDSRQIGAFPAHGDDSMIAAGRYSPFEKLGYWSGGDVEERAADDGEDILMAEARMPDPDTLPETTGRYREGLAILKEQAERGIALSSSIGWREDENAPGGNDLLEASIVGIPADPRTDSAQSGTTAVLARAAVEAGADAEAFVESVRDVVMGSNEAPVFRDLTEQQTEMAIDLLERFVEEQGNASVRNFESWLWEVDDDADGIDENAIHAAHTALEEFYRAHSPVDDPVGDTFRSWLESQPDDEDRNVSDDTDTSDDESGDTNRDEQNGTDDAAEFREFMREQQKQQTEILQSLSDALREDDEDEESDDEDEEDEESEENESDDGEDEDEDEDEDEQSSEPSDTQSIDVDGRAVSADDVRELRQAARDADVEVPENLRVDDSEESDDEDPNRAADDEDQDGPDWRA